MQKKMKQSQPKLNFTIDVAKKQIRVKSKNIKKITGNFYSINIERLFSNAPFKNAGKDALSYVQPTTTINIETTKKTENNKKDDSDSDSDSEEEAKRQAAAKKKDSNPDIVNTIEFPKNINEKSNFVLEILGDNTNLRVTKTQYNNTLYVEFNKERGDLFVGNFSKFPVVKAYVKVYLATEVNPNGFFLKDGYTDLRGRFNYLSTNVAVPDNATKVAVLVVSDSCGANIYYSDIKK